LGKIASYLPPGVGENSNPWDIRHEQSPDPQAGPVVVFTPFLGSQPNPSPSMDLWMAWTPPTQHENESEAVTIDDI